jgi:gluconolactonase
MNIEVRSPEFSDLIHPGVQIDRLATGFVFTEGPLWNARENYLIFSDIPASQIKKWTPDNGISDFRAPSGKSNGLTYDKQGRLIACEHANRRVSRTEADGTVVTLADSYDDNGVKKLNSPNDVIVKTDGSIYFSDPPWGLTAEFGELGNEELGYRGVFRLSPDGATLTLLTREFPTPNGLCFSPDESVLYINCTESMVVNAYDVQADGTIANGRTILREEGEGGAPDGMKIDERGNIYVTGPGGIWVCTPAGMVLGVIRIPEMVANLAWGGENWDTLFVTASTSLYRVPMKVRGIVVP